MKIIIKTLCFSCVLAQAMPVIAAPVIIQNETHYSVTGNSADDLLAQMKRVGPTANGAHFDAVTKYYVKWDTTYLEKSGSCQITNERVSLYLTSEFPQWANYATADSTTQQRWDKFIVDIRQHEQGHSHHGIQAAQDVEAMILSLPPMENCGEMEAVLKEKTNIIVSKYKAMDDDYDKTTNHGANQHYA